MRKFGPLRAFWGIAVLTLFVSLAAAQETGCLARWVADGDTFVLTDGRTIRLQGIDAPETAHGGRPAQLYAEESTQALRKLVMGVPLTVVAHATDRYGRVLASCLLPDGRDLAQVLVRSGQAFYYPHTDHSPHLTAALLAAQREAMAQGRGFWPAILVVSERSGPWVGNAASGRAFPQGSPQAASLSRSHRVPLKDLWDVFAQGFCPAREVSPWPLASP